MTATMSNIDYAVITMPRVSVVEAAIPLFERLVKDGDSMVRSGYRGKQSGKTFFGHHDITQRWMLIRTGDAARDILDVVPVSVDPYLSVARLDVQITCEVDCADDFIQSLAPAARYSARRITPLNDAGMTLYVGSAASDLMCRVYNKSAESGIPAPNGGELLRIEYVLRDMYADGTWDKARDGALDGVWLSLTRRMFARESSDAIITRARVHGVDPEYISARQESDDVVSRRLRWLETIVVPALNKMIAQHPESLGKVWLALDKVARSD